MILLSLIISAQSGFRLGYKQLIARLFELGIFDKKSTKSPTDRAYADACDKLPVNAVSSLTSTSHSSEFSDCGRTFQGLKVIIPDGTKISLPRCADTVEKFGEAYGHYPQCLGVGFYELSTRTFEDFKTAHMNTAERTLVLEHMKKRTEKNLYLADAGYNGMAFIAMAKEHNQEILMPLKMSSLARRMKTSKARSVIHEIKLTRIHLKNYPDHKHLLGRKIEVRLIRTRGTSRLESQVLITTLLDEKKFPWKKLSELYLQRYQVELAFRHLKVNLNLESIRKRKVLRIEQLLFAAVLLYNLAAMLRNRIKLPELLPMKKGTKMYCFSFCLARVDIFCVAVVKPQRGCKTKIRNCLRALKSCWYIHRPWRASPRICNTPPSKFSVHKGRDKIKEKENAVFLTKEYMILGREYGHIPA